MGDIPAEKWNRKEPMCFSPRNPLPKYVAKNSVKADFQRSSLAAFSVGCPPHGFLRQEGPANPSSRRRDAITRVNVRFHVALAIPFAPGNEPYKWSKLQFSA